MKPAACSCRVSTSLMLDLDNMRKERRQDRKLRLRTTRQEKDRVETAEARVFFDDLKKNHGVLVQNKPEKITMADREHVLTFTVANLTSNTPDVTGPVVTDVTPPSELAGRSSTPIESARPQDDQLPERR